MPDDDCEDMRALIQADLDGELSPPDSARVGRHLDRCAACADLQQRLITLSQRLRDHAPRFAAPDALRDAVLRSLPPPRANPRGRLAPFTAGFALAACLAAITLLPRSTPPDDVVSAHIRALQPGHLMDVPSTDQHTVKPWFDGRLPFAPPVKDLAADGFPLIGGRLDFLSGHTAAVLTYHRRLHVIDLFVWPQAGVGMTRVSSQAGYNVIRWEQDGMALSAVSDLNGRELAEFVALWRER